MIHDAYRIQTLSAGRAWLMSREARRAMYAMGRLVMAAAVEGRASVADAAKDELSRLGRAAMRTRKAGRLASMGR